MARGMKASNIMLHPNENGIYVLRWKAKDNNFRGKACYWKMSTRCLSRHSRLLILRPHKPKFIAFQFPIDSNRQRTFPPKIYWIWIGNGVLRRNACRFVLGEWEQWKTKWYFKLLSAWVVNFYGTFRMWWKLGSTTSPIRAVLLSIVLSLFVEIKVKKVDAVTGVESFQLLWPSSYQHFFTEI